MIFRMKMTALLYCILSLAPNPVYGADAPTDIKQRTEMDLVGVWTQFYIGKPIAQKEAFVDGDSVKFRYLLLSFGYIGGENLGVVGYIPNKMRYMEHYDDFNGVHILEFFNDDIIMGKQYGEGNLVRDYILVRVRENQRDFHLNPVYAADKHRLDGVQENANR